MRPNSGPQPERIAIDDEFWVEELTDPAMVAAVADQWDDLVTHAARPNVFLERWLFTSGWKTFGNASTGAPRVTVAVVFHRGKATQYPPVPIGLFPCVVDHDLGRLAGPVLSFWQHIYSYDATPVLRRGWTVAAIDVFFRWAERRHPECGLVRFQDVVGDGPLATALTEWELSRRVPSFDIGRHNRALLRAGDSYEAYVGQSISPSTQREVRRQSRRLADVGDVETTVTTNAEDAAEWAERFLALEKKGWKVATSLSSDAAHADYFRQLVVTAARMNQFEGLELSVDGRAVAMKCNFLSADTHAAGQRGGVAFKIAYDEGFKKFSPGVLLELELIRRFHETGHVDWIDSCAKSGHPMIERLWSDRTLRADTVFAVGGLRSRVAVGLWQAGRWLRRTFKPRRRNVPRANF